MKLKRRKETCPTCGKGALSPKLVDLPVPVHGVTVVVCQVRVRACDNCDEEVTALAEVQRVKKVARMLVAPRKVAA